MINGRATEALHVLGVTSHVVKVVSAHEDGIVPYVAHTLGFGTVQVQNPWPEVIVTSSTCMHSSRPLSTCLPAALGVRSGWRGSQSCTCSEALSSVNCMGTYPPRLPLESEGPHTGRQLSGVMSTSSKDGGVAWHFVAWRGTCVAWRGVV